MTFLFCYYFFPIQVDFLFLGALLSSTTLVLLSRGSELYVLGYIVKWKENFGSVKCSTVSPKNAVVKKPRRWPPTKTKAIDGEQGNGYGRVIWSPAGDGRDLDGNIPLGNAISNASATSTRPLLTTFST